MGTREQVRLKRRNRRRRTMRLHRKITKLIRAKFMRNSPEYYDVRVKWKVRGQDWHRVRFSEHPNQKYRDLIKKLIEMSKGVTVTFPKETWDGWVNEWAKKDAAAAVQNSA
jgi:hypothetical protein